MTRSDQVFQSIAARGGDPIDAPIIIEASVPLELSGEVVRSRICTFADESGREWALRPDLTLPVAQAEIAARQSGDTAERIRHYRGPVFRLPALAGEPVEFEQIGLERFAAPRAVAQDVWLFETLAEACMAAGVSMAEASFGDLSIFPAFVDALGLPGDVAVGLKRAFRQEGGVRAYLSGRSQAGTGISQRLKGLDREEIAAFVDDIYAMTGLQPVGERSADEIVERLHQSAEAAAGESLSDDVDQFLMAVLSIDLPYAEAPAELRRLAGEAGLKDMTAALDEFETRTSALASSTFGALIGQARFATRFGRRFTYYDGFVFEIASDASDLSKQRPIAAGGRYDALLSDLSDGAVNATAIGGVIIPHRIDGATGGVS